MPLPEWVAEPAAPVLDEAPALLDPLELPLALLTELDPADDFVPPAVLVELDPPPLWVVVPPAELPPE